MNSILAVICRLCKHTSKKQASAKARQQGFTLIELLVSLTIMGMILALLASGIQLLSNSWARTSSTMEDMDAASRTAALFKRDLNNIRRVVIGQNKKFEFVFRGNEQGLFFVVIEPSYPTLPGAYFIQYSGNPEFSGAGLMRSRSLYQKDIKKFPGATPANQVALLDKKFTHSFSYGRAERGILSWRRSWGRSDSLPDMIKLELKSIKTERLFVPPIVANLSITAEQACLSSRIKVCSANPKRSLSIAKQGAQNLKARIKEKERKANDRGDD